MLRNTVIAVAITLLVCSATASAAPAAGFRCAQASAMTEPMTLEQASRAVLCLVNAERALRELAPLRASPRLRRSARSHSRDMVIRRYFSHVSLGGVDVRERIRRAGYLRARPDARLGETIVWGAAGLATPAELVRAFMYSDGHRRALLDPDYRDVGVGLVRGVPIAGVAHGATLTLDFGGR